MTMSTPTTVCAPYIQPKAWGRFGVGEQHHDVARDTFGKVFNEGTEFQTRTGRSSMRCFQRTADRYAGWRLRVFRECTPPATPALYGGIVMGKRGLHGRLRFSCLNGALPAPISQVARTPARAV